MSDDFKVVFTAGKLYNAEMVKDVLENAGVEATIMNKKDSAYQFGDIEVYVSKADYARAKEIIAEVRDE